MSHYGVRFIDLPEPTPAELEAERLEDRKRWAVEMYDDHIDSLTDEQRLSETWRESRCHCQYAQVDGRRDPLYGYDLVATCWECDK